MKTLVLDGSRLGDSTTDLLNGLLLRKLEEADAAIEWVTLRDLDIAACRGCFRCWVNTPGVCCTDDPARAVAASMARADLILLLTPVTFGGYSSELKKMLDRSIGNIQPFFMTLNGETHHPERYDRAPRMLAIGAQLTHNDSAAAIFRTIAARHALNMHASAFAAGVVALDDDPETVESTLTVLLGRVGFGTAAATILVSAEDAPEARVDVARLLEVAAASSTPAGRPRRALLLVGSPRRGHSTSASLGAYVAKRLEEAGVATTTMTARGALAEDGGHEHLQAALREADLLILAFPLYVDSVPAPLIRVLERISADPELPMGGPEAETGTPIRPITVVAVVNSGFPEVHQNTYALAVCRRFAEETGAVWAGGLALGGGGAVNGADLEAAGGKARKVRMSLDQAAAALVAGDPIPGEAIELMAKPMMPPFLYRTTANLGWRRTGKKNGISSQMRDKPYAAPVQD